MKFNPDIHQRRSIRLKDYDYRQSGAYFVTICTYQKLWHFGSIENGLMTCNTWGDVVVDCWNHIPQHFPMVDLDAFVVMPNHLHGILIITNSPAAPSVERQFSKPVAKSLSSILSSFKAEVTRRITRLESLERAVVWQRNFHERIIRNEHELTILRSYIENNPALWEQDVLNKPEIGWR